MHIRCPHCHSPVEVVGDDFSDLTCQSCGIQWNPFSAETLARSQPAAALSQSNALSAGISIADDTQSLHAAPEDTRPPCEPAQPAPIAPSGSFGDYDLLEELGRGGMGIVYRARQRSADRIVALKVIRADRLADTASENQVRVLARFRLEAQLAAQLDDEHLVTVYDVGQIEGRPFYSMKYVEGQSLHETLRDGPLENRPAAQYLESAARGVQAAHRRGILHRDLKPHNILIEVGSDRALVADFGLAKLAEADGGLTLAGDVFGTPHYMSPEQALDSSQATTSSDVYSLGATLYHALTGRPPFQAATALETRAQVIGQEAVPPRELNPAVARDLETICLKAMNKEASRRYASAANLADDLRCWLRGEPIQARPVSHFERGWRWARRNPMVASFAAVALVALMAGTGVSSYFAIEADARAREAVAERERAEASLRQARQAVNDYYTTVSENKLLNVPGLQPLRKELLQTALKYYQDFLRDQAHNMDLRADFASAHARVAGIREITGDLKEAEISHSDAIAIWEDLVRQAPHVRQYWKDLAATYHNLANVHFNTGRPLESEELYQKAIVHWEKVARADPTVPAYREGLAQSYDSLAIVQDQTGHRSDAETAFRKAMDLREGLAREHPEVLDYEHDLARSYGNLAALHQLMGSRTEAQAWNRKAIDINERLVLEHPTVPDYQDQLARSYYNLAMLQGHGPRPADAEASYDKAIEMQNRLVRENPAVPRYQSGLGKSYTNRGGLQRDRGRRAEAEGSFRKAIEVQEALVRLNPATPDYQNELAITYLQLANLHRDANGSEAGMSFNRKAIEILEKLARDSPANQGYASRLAGALAAQGDLLAMSNQWRQCADAYAKAVEAHNRSWQSLWVWAIVQLAADDEAGYRAACAELLEDYEKINDPYQAFCITLACVVADGAVDDMDKVIALAAKAVQADPKNPIPQATLGTAQFRAGNTDEAITTLKRALPMHSFAAIAQPDQIDVILVSRLMGETILTLAYHKQGDRQATDKQLDVVRKLIAHLEKSPPKPGKQLAPWAVKFGIEMANRELARIEPPPVESK